VRLFQRLAAETGKARLHADSSEVVRDTISWSEVDDWTLNRDST